ncbi:MAG: GntR family transcriptional regulator [Lachnospiraceae bacterium]|nr:GntR family transcriptional regulator [Lachnospiraceae bacterium]
MHIILNQSSMVPIYEQLMDQIKHHILEGALKEQDPLPSVRALAGELKISALTVKKAYDRLEEDGFVQTVHGKGTFVAAADVELALEARKHAVEEDFLHAVEKAKAVGMSREDVRAILELILEDIKW